MKQLLLIFTFLFSSITFGQDIDPYGLWNYADKFGRERIKNYVKSNDTAELVKFLQHVRINSKTAFDYYWNKRLIPSIQKPLDCSLGVVLFRGINDYKMVPGYPDLQFADYIQPYEANVKRYKENIISFDKNIKKGNLNLATYQHSLESHNSPFISFTTSVHVASSFLEDGGKNGVYLVDPRRIIWNMTPNPKYGSEQELLLPLFTLPTEFVGYLPNFRRSRSAYYPDIAAEVAQMVRKKCLKHPYASTNNPPISQNNHIYEVRFKTEREKLLKECGCKDPAP